jgi:hypothetical protein
MKELFYTPEISEFKIGFEFESCYAGFNGATDWQKITLGLTHTWFWDAYKEDAVDTEFRVKYLDRNDLEELNIPHNEWFTGFKYSGQYKITIKEGLTPRVTVICKNHVRDGSGDYEELTLIHDLHVKNKSEFKKLLNRLNIL